MQARTGARIQVTAKYFSQIICSFWLAMALIFYEELQSFAVCEAIV